MCGEEEEHMTEEEISEEMVPPSVRRETRARKIAANSTVNSDRKIPAPFSQKTEFCHNE